MPPFSDFQRERILELGRKGNVSVNQIAARVGGTPDAVRNLLKRNGVKPLSDRDIRGFDLTMQRDLVRDRETRGRKKRKSFRPRRGG